MKSREICAADEARELHRCGAIANAPRQPEITLTELRTGLISSSSTGLTLDEFPTLLEAVQHFSDEDIALFTV